MTARAESILWLVFLAVALAAFVALVIYGDGNRNGTVYATWPDRECQHVEPARRFDCDRLPDTFDIVWVSEEWRP